MAIPTLLDLITETLVSIGELGVGNTPSPEDAAFCMLKANEMLASNSSERLNIYALQVLRLRLPAQQLSYSIGPSGAADFNQARPIKIEGAVILTPVAVTSDLISNSLDLIGEDRYRGIGDLSATANVPELLYADYAFPVMNLKPYPQPRCAMLTYMELTAWVPLQQFAALTDQFNMPPEYQAFFVENLKVVIMQAYGHEIDPFTAQQALTYKQRIQQLNAQKPDLALFNGVPPTTTPAQ